MDLLTSYKGKAHLTSMQFRALIESICGSESRIANLDEKMILELAENNTVKIRSGILIHHGAVMQVKRGTYDPITYQNGSQGMKRIDLIVAKYSKSADTKIEDAEWEIIQGEASDSDPVVPTFTEGDMQDGDLIDRCAFAELHFDGINVTEVKQLVPVARNTEELEAELDELNRKIDESYNIDTLAMFSSTGYTSQGELNLSEYKYLIFNICANKNKEDRTLGTTIIIPSSIVFDSSYTHEVKYDTTYTGVVYFTGSLGNATAIGKCSNASYGSAFLYGVK